MATISKTPRIVTVINVFFVAPSFQQWLVDSLLDASGKLVHKFPGFISSSIHRSSDGRRVVSYSQWRTRDDFERMTQSAETQAFMRSLSGIADSDTHIYEVVQTLEANFQYRADQPYSMVLNHHEQ